MQHQGALLCPNHFQAMRNRPADARKRNHADRPSETVLCYREAPRLTDDLPEHLRVLEFIVTRALIAPSESIAVGEHSAGSG
jgi:hypothetical protein